jgi:hypothetical protein
VNLASRANNKTHKYNKERSFESLLYNYIKDSFFSVLPVFNLFEISFRKILILTKKSTEFILKRREKKTTEVSLVIIVIFKGLVLMCSSSFAFAVECSKCSITKKFIALQ